MTAAEKRDIRFLALLTLCSFLLFASCASRDFRNPANRVIASWYGPEFHGRQTSSGEIFDMHGYTCAHRDLPFGTRLKVTHGENGRSVACVVNDRGPHVEGRDIDLSYAAARDIGLIHTGVAPVFIDLLEGETSFGVRQRPRSESRLLTLQAGSFRDLGNARRFKQVLEEVYPDVYISTGRVNEQTVYRVRIGKFLDREDAAAVAQSLRDHGYSVLVTRYEVL